MEEVLRVDHVYQNFDKNFDEKKEMAESIFICRRKVHNLAWSESILDHFPLRMIEPIAVHI